jgi:hypothetical protein
MMSGDGLVQKTGRGNEGCAQGDGAFNDNGQGKHGTKKKGKNRPASGVKNRKQENLLNRSKKGMGSLHWMVGKSRDGKEKKREKPKVGR